MISKCLGVDTKQVVDEASIKDDLGADPLASVGHIKNLVAKLVDAQHR